MKKEKEMNKIFGACSVGKDTQGAVNRWLRIRKVALLLLVP